MASLADRIERYLREQLARTETGVLEVQRADLSAMFNCVPSQINYVLATRFTIERGYLVESRRGGGGFIRLMRLTCPFACNALDRLGQRIGERVSQEQAGHLVRGLEESGVVSRREADLILAATHRQAIGVPLPLRDAVRARLLKAMLLSLFRHEAGGGVGDALR